MKFEVSGRVVTAKTQSEILSLLCERFKKAAKSATLDGDTVLVKSIGSVNNWDTTTVSVTSNGDGYLIDAEVNYRPGIMFWVCMLLTCWTLFGIILLAVMYGARKVAVRKNIESVFERVMVELQAYQKAA